VKKIIEFDVRKPATSFLTFLIATVIHKHPPHRLCGQCESLGATRQFGPSLILQSKPRLICQCCGLQRVIGSFATEVPPCDTPKLVVH
jgi:hypothetical protein